MMPSRTALPDRTGEPDERRKRAAELADEELAELQVDMLVAPMHEILDVLDDLQHCAASVTLWREQEDE